MVETYLNILNYFSCFKQNVPCTSTKATLRSNYFEWADDIYDCS